MALSVSISAKVWSTLTSSPSLTSQRTISPSVMPSPTSGKRNCLAMSVLHEPADRPQDALRVGVIKVLPLGQRNGDVRRGHAGDGRLQAEQGPFADRGRDLGPEAARLRRLVEDDGPAGLPDRSQHGFPV